MRRKARRIGARRQGLGGERLETRALLTGFQLGHAVYRPSNATLYFDHNRDGAADAVRIFGVPGDQIAAGDENGDGLTDTAVFRSGAWFVDLNRDSVADRSFRFGQAGDRALIGDVDGDGRGDRIVYRDSNACWYVDLNRDGVSDLSSSFGAPDGRDVPVVADFNGDARLDRAVYRPSQGKWLVDYGFNGTIAATFTFGGSAGDVPFVGDFNDDQFADLGIYRGGVMFVSTDKASVTFSFRYGAPGDVPIPGAYDFRGVAHGLRPSIGVYQADTATVSLQYTQNGRPSQTRTFGAPGDRAVAGDFDGNTVTDLAIFRNGTWVVDVNRDGAADSSFIFGQQGDVPLAGDVDGDGLADAIIFRAGNWYVSTGRNGRLDGSSIFGQAGDLPAVGDFNGDGLADRAVYRPATGSWFISFGFSGSALSAAAAFGGQAGDKPFAIDFNDDGRADIGIYRQGTWLIDTTLSGLASISIPAFGNGAGIPIPGFYDTANSFFVRAGAKGTGSEASPFGSVGEAVRAAPNGATIRIAPGTYAEEVRLNSRSNLTFVGASRRAVSLRPAVGSSFIADRSSNVHVSGMTFNSQDAAAGSGRGLVVYGSSVFARGVTTIGVRQQGVLTAAPVGGRSLLEIRDSQLDQSQSSAGLFSIGGTILRAFNTTASRNGANANLPKDQQFGRGWVLDRDTTATLSRVCGERNAEYGLVVDGATDVLVRDSVFSFNALNGAIFAGSPRFKFDRSTFDGNGANRDPAEGYCGLEVNITANGTGQVFGSSFTNHPGFGIFHGAGRLHLAGNLFANNGRVGIFINGEPKDNFSTGNSSVTLVGNTFRAPSGGIVSEAIVGRGATATAIIGGAGSKRNTFHDYRQYLVFHSISGVGGKPTLIGGDDLSLDDANEFVNCPTPRSH